MEQKRMGDHLIQLRLDKFFLSQEAIGLFGDSILIFYPRNGSNF